MGYPMGILMKGRLSSFFRKPATARNLRPIKESNSRTGRGDRLSANRLRAGSRIGDIPVGHSSKVLLGGFRSMGIMA